VVSSPSLDPPIVAASAQANLHHAYFLGLQLMVANQCDSDVVERWIFRLFRRQHEAKFLAGLEKLDLVGLPDAVACARYHVLSNSIGGVPVEYMEEGPHKAWVRFRYPRWMFDGPALCGIPEGASLGFLRGWYAHNGVSLNNPRLGFVCVSEDLSGEFGMCGYFREYPRQLLPDERLQFARDELPPPFDATAQPAPPSAQWNAERLQKANRNYALEYVRNGLIELSATIGAAQAEAIGSKAARLIGLQYYRATAAAVAAHDGDARDAAHYLCTMMRGLGDDVQMDTTATATKAVVRHRGLRILRDLDPANSELLLACWTQLWTGAIRSHRALLDLHIEREQADMLTWTIVDRRALA